jgi:hypothetical protein
VENLVKGSHMKKLILVTFFTLAAVGCKTTETQYHYGEYPTAVYSYFKADEVTIDQQITILEQVVEEAAANSKPIAPGVHAHLGMLYFETGNSALGAQHFDQEKALFPESVLYIDFLLKSAKEA